jgi:hypothetical protein
MNLLKNTLPFSLAAGATAVIPHLLYRNGYPVVPDVIFVPDAQLSVTADTTAVTITNNGSDLLTGSLLVESWHNIERAFGGPDNLPVQPYVVVGGDSTAMPVSSVVYRPGDPDGSRGNVYVTWQEAYDALMATAGLGIRFLEFDSSFSMHESEFGPACPIPAGTWNMLDVTWTNSQFPTTIDILAGATFLNLRHIWAQSLTYIVNDGAGPVPIVDPLLLLNGPIRIQNSHVGAGPLFSFPNFGVISFANGAGMGLERAPAPYIDAAGGFFFLSMGSGWIADNSLTDSVGGSFMLLVLSDDSAMGGGDTYQTYDFPLFFSGGGELEISVEHRDRHVIEEVVSEGPVSAIYNGLIRVDTTAEPITVNLPRAMPARGERVVVKDVGGNADTNAITIAATGEDTVEGAASITINANRGSAILVCDGYGAWVKIN